MRARRPRSQDTLRNTSHDFRPALDEAVDGEKSGREAPTSFSCIAHLRQTYAAFMRRLNSTAIELQTPRAWDTARSASASVASCQSPGYRASRAHWVNWARSVCVRRTDQVSGRRLRNASRSCRNGKSVSSSTSAAFKAFSAACWARKQAWRGREPSVASNRCATSRSSMANRSHRRAWSTSSGSLIQDLPFAEC